jgi:chromosome partitioning protein
MTNIGRLFARYAALCRDVQRKAIELENHPNKRKQLRRFSSREAAEILGVSPGHLRNLVREDSFPQGEQTASGRRSFALEEIHLARTWLFRATGHPRYAPKARRPGERLQVVTFVNFKGGSGKTTSAVHFAQYLALRGYRILLADLDPQASATALFGIAPASEVGDGDTFASWVRRVDDGEDLTERLPRPTYWAGLDLLPANIGLQHAEYELVGRLLARRDWPFYGQLAALLALLAPRYDVVVCDCRPDVGMLTINALAAATGLVVPVPPAMVDFASTGEFFRFMAEVATDLREQVGGEVMDYAFVRVLMTKFRQADRNQAEMVSWTRTLFREATLDAAMVETAAVDAGGILKETLYEYEPSGNRRSHERALEALNRVNAAIEGELLAVWARTAATSAEAA